MGGAHAPAGDGLGRSLLHDLTIPPADALAVVITTVVIYCVFVVILAVSRQRLYGRDSVLEFATVAVLGAIVGRTTLGLYPTLATGVVALAMLGVLTVAGGVLRARLGPRLGAQSRLARWVGGTARVVMVDGSIRDDALPRLRMDEQALWAALRAAGVRDPGEVAVAVVERTGRLSVLRSGVPIDPRVLDGVEGSEAIPPELLAGRG